MGNGRMFCRDHPTWAARPGNLPVPKSRSVSTNQDRVHGVLVRPRPDFGNLPARLELNVGINPPPLMLIAG